MIIVKTGGYWESAAPVIDERDRLAGVVYMTFSSRPYDQALKTITRTVLTFALVSIILAAVVAYLFGSYLSSLFIPLIATIRRSAVGELGSRTPLVGVKELDEVGTAYNRMSFLVDRRVRDLERLNQMTADLPRSKSVEDFAASLSSTCSMLVPRGVCALLVGDPTSGILRLIGDKVELKHVTPACGVSIAAREHRTISIGVESDFPPGTQVAEGVRPESAITSPMITLDEGTVGAILVTFDENDIPSPPEIDIASVATIANLAAPILASMQRVKAQDQAVEALKDILIPDTPTDLIGAEVHTRYEPAEKLTGFGGDYYDVLEIEDNFWGIVIGDVSGHGLDAGRYTAMAKYVIRSYALETSSPGDILTRANTALVAQMGGYMFISVFLATLDLNTHKLTYSCAGHPPALFYSKSNGTIRELDVGGSVLGITAGINYDEESIDMYGDDLLVLYTDGIIEARRHTELYGTERLIALIKENASKDLPDIANIIVDDVRTFAEGRFLDDLAMVMIRPLR
jgi:serine phosphatase RsbU (regulator of sigma subunit)